MGLSIALDYKTYWISLVAVTKTDGNNRWVTLRTAGSRDGHKDELVTATAADVAEDAAVAKASDILQVV